MVSVCWVEYEKPATAVILVPSSFPKVEIKFEPALVGMFILVLEEGKGIEYGDLPAEAAAHRNPYVVATLGEM